MNNTECDMTKCKNDAVAIGRHISDLSFLPVKDPETEITILSNLDKLQEYLFYNK